MLDKYEILVAEKEFEREFGQLKYVDAYKSDSPEIWQKWWANRVVGNDDDDGPWNSPPKGASFIREASYALLDDIRKNYV